MVRSLDRYPLMPIVRSEQSSLGTGVRGDKGNTKITLGCGHTMIWKTSQVCRATRVRCRECGDEFLSHLRKSDLPR